MRKCLGLIIAASSQILASQKKFFCIFFCTLVNPKIQSATGSG